MYFNRAYVFYTTFSISRTKIMNLNKCYFRYRQKEGSVDLTFLMNFKESARQFNFSRKPTESIQTLFTRIGTNVQKAINKYNKKKCKTDSQAVVEVIMYDYKDDPVPNDSTCLDLFTMPSPLKLKIHDQVYEAIFNAPWVVSINLPQIILAGFPVYPEHFVAYFSIKEKSNFNWYRGLSVKEGNAVNENLIKWEFLGDGFCYVPSSKDIGMKLKLECIPGNLSTTGPAVEAISKNLVEAGPDKCPFETRHLFTSSKLSDKSFRCVSYNILADLYCDSDFTRRVLHPYCPPYALHIDYRKQLILKELLGYNADILCLQEVDRKIFQHCLQPFLEWSGYGGSFYKKGKEVAEGLACFYREDRFSFLSEEIILLSEAIQSMKCLEPIWHVIKDNKVVERLLDRSTIASATILQSNNNSNEVLIVANTHLYFHPDADHIRLIQGGVVIYWLEYLKNNVKQMFPDKRVSLIICGDFNSVPSCGVYQLYTTGSAPDTLADWVSNANEAVHKLSLRQNISLGSACGTPPFTNFTEGFADCLDYIYFEKSNLKVVQVVPFPSEEELRAHIALPSIVFPSDHIALISDLSFK